MSTQKRGDSRSQFDEEEMGNSDAGTTSALLAREDEREVPFCGCLSVKYYQPFFDIETADIIKRISTAALYLKRDDSFMTLIRDKPDAYGPFWVRLHPFLIYIITNTIDIDYINLRGGVYVSFE